MISQTMFQNEGDIHILKFNHNIETQYLWDMMFLYGELTCPSAKIQSIKVSIIEMFE